MPWRDEEYSRRLPDLRLAGESQTLEFKRQLPAQLDDLAKQIAAFASSNAGDILIGVEDDGTLVGIAEANTVAGRESLKQRVQGICTSAVRPSITPRVVFAQEGEHIVLIIAVPKGPEPVYYVDFRPYIRHLTESRRAQPNEVIELFRAWTTSNQPAKPKPQQVFLQGLFVMFAEITSWYEEADLRQVNPWLDTLRYLYGGYANSMREMTHDHIAKELEIVELLGMLADALDGVSHLRMHFGAWPDYLAKHEEVKQLIDDIVTAIKDQGVDLTLDRTSIIPLLQSHYDRLQVLSDRAHALIEQNRREELQREAADFGRRILTVVCHPLLDGDSDFARLKTLGHRLTMTETLTIYMDGGASLQKLEDEIVSATRELGAFLDSAGQRPQAEMA